MTDSIASPPAGPGLALRIWRFPLVALVVSLLAFVLAFGGLGLAVNALPIDWPEDVAIAFNGIVAALLSAAIYKLVVARLGESPHDDLPTRGFAGELCAGIFGASILMTVIVGIVALLGGYQLKGMGGATSWPMILFLAGFQAAVMEEVLFRGILFRFLEEFGGSWFALALTSGLFGVAHIANENATPFSSLAIALEAGVMLGGAYMLTRSLWLPIGIHFGWNVTQGLVWDVPVSGNAVDGVVDAAPAGSDLVSGGAFGVEASVVALVLATAVGLWLVVRAIRAGHLVRPWWVRRRLAREAAAVAA